METPMMNGLDWGMGLGRPLWMVLGVVLVVVVVWAVVSVIRERDRAPIDDAAQILRARRARGEISNEEFEQARRLLGI
jgi:uncharacterized membrane protein